MSVDTSLALLGILLYAWSSKIGGGQRTRTHATKQGVWYLTHGEARGRRWLLDSGVCPAGKASWVFWASVMSLAAFPTTATYLPPALLRAMCVALTVILTLVLNRPLFGRCVLAFVTIGVMISRTHPYIGGDGPSRTTDRGAAPRAHLRAGRPADSCSQEEE